jgi:hypothetical protein
MNNDLINRWAYLFQKLSMGSSPISFEQGTRFLSKTNPVNIKTLIIPEPVLGNGREKYFYELNQRKNLAVSRFEQFVNLHSPQSLVTSSPGTPSFKSPTDTPVESDVENDTPVESPVITPVRTPVSSAPQSPIASPIVSRNGSPNSSPQKQSLPPLPVDPFGPLLPAMNDGTKNSPRSPRSAKKFSFISQIPQQNTDQVHLSDVSLKFGDIY